MTDETEQKPSLHSIIRETLGNYHLSNMTFAGTGDPYPLVDLLSNDGPGATIETGQEQIALIADEIAFELRKQGSDTAMRKILEVLGVGNGRDAALNLEGAIDSLTISHKLSEDDAIIRTLRRVLGQIEETIRIAEIEHVTTLAD